MKVFISYSSHDGFAARILELWLREAGFTPLRDDQFLRPKSFPNQLHEKISSCDLFLGILTPHFHRSKWTLQEVEWAALSNKPLLFVAIHDRSIPPAPHTELKPLELWRIDPAMWRAELIRSVRDLISGRDVGQDLALDRIFSRNYVSNPWVLRRVAQEQLGFSHLYVASCIELAAKWSGWSADEIVGHESGDFPIDAETQQAVDSQMQRLFPASLRATDSKENYSLRSLREDLSDEPFLSLNLQQVSHMAVRAVADTFQSVLATETSYLHLFEPGNLLYPHSVVVHMVAVTQDNYLLIGHRSARPRYYENCWSVSYEEHMHVGRDGPNPFNAAIRGLKEELIGDRREHGVEIAADQVRFFSVFRELDHWTNVERGESFFNINVGLAGLVRVPLPVETVFRNWQQHAEDKREFRHLVAIPYTFDNLFELLSKESIFDPAVYGSALIVPEGVNPRFPDLLGQPHWRRQHPTNYIRIIRCLTYDFLDTVAGRLLRQE